MGYWVVVAMLGCAVAAVAAALTTGRDEPRPAGRPDETWPVGRSNELPPVGRPDEPRAASAGAIWVALGASDATGDGTPDPERDNWVARLAASLPDGVSVHNLGVGGSTLAEARRDQLPAALALRPDVSSLWLAVNDLVSGVPLDAYDRDLGAVLGALGAMGCRMVIGNVPDLTLLPGLPDEGADQGGLRGLVERWNAVIAARAAETGARLVDLYAVSGELVTNAGFLGADGFHPSAAGHDRLAQIFAPEIRRALAEAAPDARSSA